MENKGYKRRNYLIDKNFQGKFILRFSLLVLFGGLLTIVLLYLLAMQSTTVEIHNSRVVARTTADFILPLLFQTVIIVTVLTGLITIAMTMLFSHKISGPLYRFKKVMEALKEGDFSLEFGIRQLDQFHDLADAFNSMIRNTKQELFKLKEDIVSLKDKLYCISEQDVAEDKRQALNESKNLTEELNKIVKHFKT